MMTLEQIRAQLKDRRIDLVSKGSGVHYNTVVGIRDNEEANPTWRVLKALSDYLEGK